MLNKRNHIVCVLIGILFSVFVTGSLVQARKDALQEQVASQVLRFHVLANSDSEEDQALKMQVKQKVLDFIKAELPESESLAETKNWVSSHLSEIQMVAKEKVEEAGYSYRVKAEIRDCQFPVKTYGDITFPAGTYEALRIEIGEAEGQNWWCVLYPNLCFYDAIHAVVPEEGKEELEEVLDQEAYELVTSRTIFKIRWFFF